MTPRPRRERTHAAGADRAERLAALAIAGASLVLYLPSLRNGFVWDDTAQVLANRWLTSWSHLGEIFSSGVWDFDATGITNYYRPLMHVAYLAVYSAFGPAAWAFHLVNVLVNAVNAALVVLLAAALLDPRSAADAPDAARTVPVHLAAALAAGILFAFHPVHSEAVLWVAALPELGATACALAVALVYVRALRANAGIRPYVVAALLFFAGALFKETAGLVGPFLVVCDLVIAPGDRFSARVRRLAPVVAAGLAYLAVRRLALGDWSPVVAHGEATATGWSALLPTFARYLGALAWPLPLNAYWDTPRPGTWAASGVAVALVCVAFVAAFALAWWRDRRVALGLTLFLLALLPAFFTSAISGARLAERYLYLPSAGAAIAGAAVLERLAARRERLVVGVVATCALLASIAVWMRIPDWRDELSLWSDTAGKAPNAPSPRYNLGVALLERGELSGAAEQLAAVLQRHPTPVLAASALNDLGRIAERGGRADLALAYFRRAVETWPDSAAAQSNLGGALAERGQLQDALPHLAAAARLRPREAGTRLNLALVLLDLGRRDEGLSELAEASRLAPADPEIQARARAEQARAAATPVRQVQP